jgi:hypothetical protein
VNYHGGLASAGPYFRRGLPREKNMKIDMDTACQIRDALSDARRKAQILRNSLNAVGLIELSNKLADIEQKIYDADCNFQQFLVKCHQS